MRSSRDRVAELGAVCLPLERQGKPGRSCELQGVHLVDYPFDKWPGKREGEQSFVAKPCRGELVSRSGSELISASLGNRRWPARQRVVKPDTDGEVTGRTTGEGQTQDLKFKRKAATMPINHEEMIEEIEGHIRKFGGEFGEWCVGTAKDSRGPFFRRHLAADLGDGLIYREAFTTSAAGQVVDHLVNDRGLQLDQEAERRSALHDAVPEPGKIVFVYRNTAPARSAPAPDRPAFRKLAA